MGTLALALFAGTADAQNAKHKHKHKSEKTEMVGKHHDRALDDLNLSTEQKNRVAQVNETFRTQMQDLRNQTGLTEEERRARRELIQRQHVDNIHAVLSEEQRAKYNERQTKQVKETKTKYRNGEYKRKTKTKPAS